MGDWKPLRDGVSEMRIDVGLGYRLYFTRRGSTVVVRLCGGDKRKQHADIERAIDLAKPLTINIPEGFSRWDAAGTLKTDEDAALYSRRASRKTPATAA